MPKVVSIFGRKYGTKKPTEDEPYTYVLFHHLGGMTSLWRHKRENYPEFLQKNMETGELSWSMEYGTIGYEYDKAVAESYAPVKKENLPSQYRNLPD